MKRAVFLDRDGTLNRARVIAGKPYPPRSLSEFEIYAEAFGALDRLKEAGFMLIVATNQPDVARGRQSRETVEAMHRRLTEALRIDDFRVCYEVDSPTCACYKPKPGLLLAAAADHGFSLADSFMIGDRWRDVGAGKAAACGTVFIDRGYTEELREVPDLKVTSLAEAAEGILNGGAARHGEREVHRGT